MPLSRMLCLVLVFGCGKKQMALDDTTGGGDTGAGAEEPELP